MSNTQTLRDKLNSGISVPTNPNAPPLDEVLKNIEEDLYQALDGFEAGDLIRVRQCTARAQSNATTAWQIKRRK